LSWPSSFQQRNPKTDFQLSAAHEVIMEIGLPVQIGKYPCPYCKWLVDGAVAAGPGVKGKASKPSAGDFGICAKCCNWIVYTEDNVREITIKDIEEMSQTNFDDLVKMGLVLHQMHQVKRRLLGK
jgi:hypothetical protein